MKSEEIDDSSAPLIEHLAELRNRLMWSAAAFCLALFAVYPFAMQVFNFLSRPICNVLESMGQNCQLVLISPQEGFFVAINISLFGGLVLAFPVIAYHLWRFVAPGLYRSEKNAFLPFLVASPLMTGNTGFAHQTASQMSPDTMPLCLQFLGKGARPGGCSGFLVMLDQHGLKFLPLRLHLALALTPGVKAAAVDSKRPTAIVDAVLLVQLVDQRK